MTSVFTIADRVLQDVRWHAKKAYQEEAEFWHQCAARVLQDVRWHAKKAYQEEAEFWHQCATIDLRAAYLAYTFGRPAAAVLLERQATEAQVNAAYYAQQAMLIEIEPLQLVRGSEALPYNGY